MAQEAQPVSSSSGASAATASVAASAGQANSPVLVSGAQSAKSAPSAAATAAAPAAVPKLDLSQYPDAKALESLGIDALKVPICSSPACWCHTLLPHACWQARGVLNAMLGKCVCVCDAC